MKKKGLVLASEVLRNKKGIGRKQKTKVKLELEIEAGVIETHSTIEMLWRVIYGMNRQALNGAPVTVKLMKEEVESEHFNNPDWKL